MKIARLFVVFLFSFVFWQANAVELNQANASELQQIKGIGPKTAERIIAERTRGGAFESLQDLSDRVKGIGPKRVTALKAAGLKTDKAVAANSKPNKKRK